MRGAEWVSKDEYRLRTDAKRFEDWELPYTLLAGCKAAVDYALSIGLKEIGERNSYLCTLVLEQLRTLGLETLDRGNQRSSIITVRIPGKESADVLNLLRSKNINTSIAHRNSAIIDFDAKGVTWALRISPHYYNSEKDVNALSTALREIVI
jgi:selenocysteine lyase/cysteine desulfurase